MRATIPFSQGLCRSVRFVPGRRATWFAEYLSTLPRVDAETSSILDRESPGSVLKRGDQFNGKSRFDTWLFTIARNLVIDTRRKRTMSSLEAMREGAEDGRSFDIPADGPSPFDRYQSSENGQRVAEALLTLEPLHREVLVLRFHEELSLEEIAQVTQAPLSTVKSRLYRGLSALRPRIFPPSVLNPEGETR